VPPAPAKVSETNGSTADTATGREAQPAGAARGAQ
jgi:hypothetical protein